MTLTTNNETASPMATSTDHRPGTTGPAAPTGEVVVGIRRRTIDSVLIGLGVVVIAVLAVAGGLLTWGSNFATDYVNDELTAQNIVFNDAASLEAEGRGDLVKYAGEQVNTGQEAEAYASYIDGHLTETAGGLSYAELGGPERAAKAAVTDATAAGASEDEIAALQADADEITAQRTSLFKGETLRGLLLSTFAWSTIGRISGIAAMAAFVAAGMMIVLVALGLVHHRKTVKS